MDWVQLMQYLFIVSVALNAIMMPLLGFVVFFGRPAFTYAMAKLRGKDLLALFLGNDRFRLVPSDYKGLEVLRNKAWINKRKKAWNWGGVQVVPVYDEWGITYDPQMEQAVRALEQIGIASYEELEERIRTTEEVKKEIMELYAKLETEKDEEEKKKIQKKIDELKAWLSSYGISRNDPVVYRAFGVVTIKDIEDYFTDMYPSEIKAHIDENVAEIARQYVNPINKVGAYVLYAVMLFIGGGIGIYLIKAAFGG